MKFTRNKVLTTIRRNDELHDLAEEFLEKNQDKYPRRGYRKSIFFEGDNLYYETNTACHCHPEYEHKSVSLEEFINWIEQQNEH